MFSVAFKFIAMIIGVVGNTTVIVYSFFWTKEKTVTSYLVGNLAFADLFVCLTFYPIWIIEFMQTILEIESDQDLFCKLSRTSLLALLFVSVCTLFAITIDKYVYIVKPLKYPLIVTQRRIIFFIVAIWIATFGVLSPVIQNFFTRYEKYRGLCRIDKSTHLIYELLSQYIPIVIIIFLNVKILCVAKMQRKKILKEINIVKEAKEPAPKRKNNLLQQLRSLKATKTFFIVVLVLVFCLLFPVFMSVTINRLNVDRRKKLLTAQIWYAVLHYELYGINAVINPFIYGMRHAKYRKAYENIILRMLLCLKNEK